MNRLFNPNKSMLERVVPAGALLVAGLAIGGCGSSFEEKSTTLLRNECLSANNLHPNSPSAGPDVCYPTEVPTSLVPSVE